MLRAFLAVALLWAVSAQAGTPTLDAAGVAFGGAKTVNSVTVSVTTSGTNRVIILQIRPVDSAAPSASVSSVSDVSALTWAKRTGISSTMANCFSGNTCFSDSEIWWACAAAAQAADVVTVNLSKTVNEVMVAGYGVAGTNSCSSPWDTNPALPLLLSNTTAVDNAIASTFSAPFSAHSMLLMLEGQSVNFGPVTGCLNGSIPSSDTIHNTCFTVGGCNVDYNWLTDADWGLTACQAAPSSVTAISSLCGHTTIIHAWEMVVDALAGDAVASCGGGGGGAVIITPQVEVNE